MQAQETRSTPKLLLYGCQMSGLPQDHYRIQPRANGGAVQGMLHNPMHANRRQGEIEGRMFV